MNEPLQTVDQHWPPALLKKAESFLRQGKVDELEQTGNGQWIAYVRDTRDCDVQIQLPGNEVTGCQCDCGAETMPCEHAAAVLLALRDRLAGTAAKPAKKAKTALDKKPARKKKETFEDILNRVPPEELKAFLKDAFGRQRDFRNMFMARFAEPDDSKGKEGYAKLVKSILRSGTSRWGYIDGRGIRKITKPMNELVRQAQVQIDKKQFLGPVQLGQVLLEEVSDRHAGQYDNTGFLQSYIEEGVGFFEKALASEYAAQTLKDELWNYLLEQFPKPQFLDYGGTFHVKMMETLVRHAQAGEQEARMHAALDQLLRTLVAGNKPNYIQEHRRKYWLSWKIALYQRLGREAEANALLDANLHIPEFRRIKAEAAIEAERWDEAIALISDGIAEAQRQQHPGTVVQWKQLLLHIARLRNDLAQIRALSLDLFRSDRYRLEYYQILKASYPPAEWPPVSRSLIDEMTKRDCPGEYLLPVLQEEQDWKGMFEAIRKEARFHLLFRYEPVLLEHFPEATENLYVGWLRLTADEASNRDAYKQVVEWLQNLAKYPNGKENTVLLLREFRARYGRRSAMLEELSKIK